MHGPTPMSEVQAQLLKLGCTAQQNDLPLTQERGACSTPKIGMPQPNTVEERGQTRFVNWDAPAQNRRGKGGRPDPQAGTHGPTPTTYQGVSSTPQIGMPQPNTVGADPMGCTATTNTNHLPRSEMQAQLLKLGCTAQQK